MTNYAQGANAGREIANALRENGWYVMRSSGSHGLADLIAIRKGKVLVIQLKRQKLGEEAETKLLKRLIDTLPEGYYHLSPKLLTGRMAEMKETIKGW